MKRIYLIVLAFIIFSCSNSKYQFETDALRVSIDSKGNLSGLTDTSTGKNYYPKGEKSPLLTLYENDTITIKPKSIEFDKAKSVLTLSYPNGSVADMKLDNKGKYLRFELLSLEPRNGVSCVGWGPYALTLDKYIGETVCVVRDEEFAIGMQALEINTITGIPSDSQFDENGGLQIIDPLPGQEVPDSIKDRIGERVNHNVNKEGDIPAYVRLYRGNAAFRRSYGSEIRLFSRDRRETRIIGDEGKKMSVEGIDVDFVGSAIAFFGSPEPEALDYIEQIEIGEGLPHSMIDGIWIKRHPKAGDAHIAMGADVVNFENTKAAFEYVKKCNFDMLYIGGVFKSWGHFDLNPKAFPKGDKSLKKLVDMAAKEGIGIGIHTLTMFTGGNDKYVSPVPSEQLAKTGVAKLAKDVSVDDEEIYIDDPLFFINADHNHAAKIGKEIIRYDEVSSDKPYRLLNCNRGAYGTTASSHKTGGKIEKLKANVYSGFYPDLELQDKYAQRFAEICNNTGISQIEFDGFDRHQSGHGLYGSVKFAKEFYDNLDKPVFVGGSGSYHYYWHMCLRFNWGEPWYDRMRDSQVNYRLENQRYYKRNFFPGGLGWFSFKSQFRLEDIEWLQARSAGFDAGYLLGLNKTEVESCGFMEAHFEAIREWQKARKAKAFSEDQIARLQNPKNEFHLEKVSNSEWKLYQLKLKDGYSHSFRHVQDGEPVISNWKYNNPYDNQNLQFYMYVNAGSDGANGSISNIKIEINNYTELLINETLKPKDKLYCDGKKVYLCDDGWKIKKELVVSKIPKLKKGDNNLVVMCDFKGNKPVIEMDLKTVGKAETVKSN